MRMGTIIFVAITILFIATTITIGIMTFQEHDWTGSKKSNGVVSEYYIACGCGCCAEGQLVNEVCLYRSRGDNLNKIVTADQDYKTSDACEYVGCSYGVKYKYCDQ